MRFKSLAVAATALLVAAAPVLVHAQDSSDKPAAKDADKADKKDKPDWPPLPADKSVRQSAVIGGRTVNYTATVGPIPVS